MMKFKSQLLAISSILLFCAASPMTDELRIEAFRKALGAEDQALFEFQKSDSGPPNEVEAAINAAFSAWANLPESSKPGRYDQLNRKWFELAQVCAQKMLYQEALEYLNKEVAYQYIRNDGTYLSGQNRDFFRDVVLLEADVLGHLGRSYYPRLIDHYLMPVDVNGDGIDEFVALERTTADEERGIDIPALPTGGERKILYLLMQSTGGRYVIKSSVQVIGLVDKKSETGFVQTEQGQVLSMSNVTHLVHLDPEGIPDKYVPTSKSYVQFRLTADGFELLN